MNTIFELCKSTIELGNFTLSNKLNELTAIMLVGQIDLFEYDELTKLAQKYANQETESNETNILGALKKINEEIICIKNRISTLENANGNESDEEQYPEWVRWNGLPTSGYRFGDKVVHQGVKYVSNYVGLNVWEPGLLGTETLWTVIE